MPSTPGPALAPGRLALPSQVPPKRIRWDLAFAIALIHALALAAVVPYFFSWAGLIALIIGVHLFGQGINIGYHRLLTHRSFQTPWWVERTFVWLALCCLEGSPARWVATHRFHHNNSDEQEDPHSPLVAFLWGHIGWILVRNPRTQNIEMYHKYARDLLRNPYYMRLEKGWGMVHVYLLHAALFFAGGALVPAIGGAPLAECLRMGLSLVIWGVLVRTVVVWHITWSVNSLSHLFGYRSYDTGENSRNNWLVALLTVGEGWHNNHHHDPASASVQHKWWEIDISYYQIRLLERLGLAWKVMRPRGERHAERDERRTMSDAA